MKHYTAREAMLLDALIQCGSEHAEKNKERNRDFFYTLVRIPLKNAALQNGVFSAARRKIADNAIMVQKHNIDFASVAKSGCSRITLLPFVALLGATLLALCRAHWLEAALFAALAGHMAFMLYAARKADRRPKYDLH